MVLSAIVCVPCCCCWLLLLLLQVADKIQRYMRRSVSDVITLQRYLAK